MMHREYIGLPHRSVEQRSHVFTLLVVFSYLCVMGTPGAAFAGDSTAVAKSHSRLVGSDVAIFFREAGEFFTAPLHFSSREWLYTAGAAAGSALVMTSDLEIKHRAGKSTDQPSTNVLWTIPRGYGSWPFAGAFATITYGTGVFSGNDEIRVTGRLLLESLLVSGGSALVIRFIFGRSRPYGNNRQWDFNWFQLSDTYQSFPSGHTVAAFSISTVLAERIDNVWARIGFYGLASMTAIERVHDNQHWASDVLAGAGLGLLGGFFVIGKEHEREQGDAEPSGRLHIQPTLTGMKVAFRIY